MSCKYLTNLFSRGWSRLPAQSVGCGVCPRQAPPEHESPAPAPGAHLVEEKKPSSVLSQLKRQLPRYVQKMLELEN